MNSPLNYESVFKLNNVSVSYGTAKAIQGVSFELRKGQAIGLIGANGAGKTSSIRALLGMVPIREGEVQLLGQKKCTPQTLKRLGFAPEEASPPEYLTAVEYLQFLGKFKVSDSNRTTQEIDELLSWFELNPDKRVSQYSKGMRRRLILAQAFLGKPELLILDEPLNGLDPLMIQKLRDKLRDYRAMGVSILYSSHILSELENCCTDVVMMDHGSVIMQESVTNLVQQFGSIEKAFTAKMGAQTS